MLTYRERKFIRNQHERTVGTTRGDPFSRHRTNPDLLDASGFSPYIENLTPWYVPLEIWGN